MANQARTSIHDEALIGRAFAAVPLIFELHDKSHEFLNEKCSVLGPLTEGITLSCAGENALAEGNA
jgi:hypothetical protein